MATVAEARRAFAPDEKFFLTAAIVMVSIIIAGFTLNLAMGRSSFGSPLHVHVHAFLCFAWVALYVAQNVLVASGRVALHRRLGWAAVLLLPVMVFMGIYTTVEMARAGRVPFFFTPGYFLVMDPLTMIGAAGLATAALHLRRHTQWHRRLMFCAMTILVGPAVGRLLPMPFLIPWAGLAVFAVLLLFPLAGVAGDLRRSGSVHPAWWWGIGAMTAIQLVVELLGHSALIVPLYASLVAGSPGASIAPLAYPPMPPL